MATYYVHGDYGDDGNAGSLAAPFATVGQGISSLSSEDTLKIKGGIEYEVDGELFLTDYTTIQPYDTDGEKPILKMKEADTHFISFIPALEGDTLIVKNIIFVDEYNRDISIIKFSPAINPVQNATIPRLQIYNCDFHLYSDPFLSALKRGVLRTALIAGNPGEEMVMYVQNCTFFRCLSGVYVHGSDKAYNLVYNSLFVQSGNYDQLAGAIHALRNINLASGVVLTSMNNYFFGCGYPQYTVGDDPTIVSLNDVDGDEYGDPRLTDPDTYDFHLLSDSPAIDMGKSGLPDTNRPPGFGSTTGDIGGYGGDENLSEGSELSITINGITYTGLYPYDVISIVGKDFFIKWIGDTDLLNAIQDDVYTKSTTIYVSASLDGLSLTGVRKRRPHMSAGKHDIIIEQGTDFVRKCTYRDENQDAIDLSSGYTARMKIKERKSDANALVSLTNQASGEGIIFDTTGFTINILASTTEALDFDWGVYDLELVNSGSGKVIRLLEGTVRLDKEVTS